MDGGKPMSKIKKAASILVAMIMMLGVCSCMENIDYEKEMIRFLEEKYQEKGFSITQLTKEFSGSEGVLTRAVCQSERFDEKFTVYLYETEQLLGEVVNIDGKSYAVQDNYADLVFAQEYAGKIADQFGEATMVKCQFLLRNYYITKETYEAGVEAFLLSTAFTTFPRIYMILDKAKEELGDAFVAQVQTEMERYGADNQYLYLVYSEDANVAEWEAAYSEHYDRFDTFLKETDLTQRVEVASFESGQTLWTMTTIKGGE